ncbi:HlyC/CorC family transporter [Kiloniella laminariae]|uniref:HlyC/CorC family transporter n=1 Tax=Kiloniella laminariae TaxID=454162 RepID=A0ABT4LM60_9PROT|nr:HlyC/CorC family transporter [Kiloniella laminariae]MCZ4282183.1 HlyC/CorC family transporter [Kiloniella laminariae]
METELILSIGIIIVLLILSAFFSGAETSMTASSKPRMHTLEQGGDKNARIVNNLWSAKERLIGSILLGNNLVNILASSIATSTLIGLFGETGVVYATLVMTAMVLIFAEVLPKTYALRYADKAALASAPILRPIVYLFGPIALSVEAIVHATLSLFTGKDINVDVSEVAEEELRGAIDLHEGQGEEIRHERAMLRSILDLDDVTVEEIMTHRQHINACDANDNPSKIIEDVLSSPYTRIPLWKDRQDNIVGVLHAKALLRAVRSHEGELDQETILSITNEPWFIPASTSLLSQLHAFRDRHAHFAIVVDEYGEMQGIVTLEDILEEIVGDISDEHDVEIEGVQSVGDDQYIVNGTVTIRDLNRQFEWRLPDDEASTIAGLILYEARQIPQVGQAFVFHNMRFEILERKRHQIISIRVSPLPE